MGCNEAGELGGLAMFDQSRPLAEPCRYRLLSIPISPSSTTAIYPFFYPPKTTTTTSNWLLQGSMLLDLGTFWPSPPYSRIATQSNRFRSSVALPFAVQAPLERYAIELGPAALRLLTWRGGRSLQTSFIHELVVRTLLQLLSSPFLTHPI